MRKITWSIASIIVFTASALCTDAISAEKTIQDLATVQPAKASQIQQLLDAMSADITIQGLAAGEPAKASQIQQLLDAINEMRTCKGNSEEDIMVRVGALCVDVYEANVFDKVGNKYGESDDYPSGFPKNGNGTDFLYAVSKANELPSRYITWFQAQQACANAGKRLLTNAEWQMASAGTPITDAGDCNQDVGQIQETGSYPNCRSRWGIYDMAGNVMEWVADWMQGGRGLWDPLDNVKTSPAYGEDTVHPVNELAGGAPDPFPMAVVRGGSTFSADDGKAAGIFNFRGLTPSMTDWSGLKFNRVGFRCARPLGAPSVKIE